MKSEEMCKNVSEVLRHLAGGIDRIFIEGMIDPSRLNDLCAPVREQHDPNSFIYKLYELVECELEKNLKSQADEYFGKMNQYYGIKYSYESQEKGE